MTESYSKVVGDVGVQVGCELAEGGAALAKGIMDMIASNTESTADDTAFPYVQKAVGSGFRIFADKWVAKRQPGLAKVMSAFGSAMNGAVALDFFRAHGVAATRRAAERLQGRSSP